MRILSALLLFMLVSCSQALDKPKNLIAKDEMSAIIADFAIAGQLSALEPNASLEKQSLYILQSHKISAKDFSDSYKYYISTPRELEKIYNNAQQIIKDNPEAEAYISKKTKENGAVPAPAK